MHAKFSRFCKQRIVNISHVANALDDVSFINQSPLQNVVTHKSKSMANVSRVVWRNATRVHQNFFVRSKINHTSLDSVVQLNRHLVAPRSGIPVSRGATRVL